MAARGSKSRKGSGASSASKQPPDPVFFIDKCLGLTVVPGALRAAGVRVELMTDHFEQDAPDVEWLAEVGKRGWIVLSKDQHLKHNHLEIVALLKANTYSFILVSANATGVEMAQAFVKALPQMQGIIGKMPPPLVGTVTKTSVVRVVYTHDRLMQRAVESESAPKKPPRK